MPTIELFDIIDDEKTKEKHAANQFFSSLLGIRTRCDLESLVESRAPSEMPHL